MDDTRLHQSFGRLLRREPLGSDVEPTAFAAWARRHRLAPYAFDLSRGVDPDVGRLLAPVRLQAAALYLHRRPMYAELFRLFVSNGVTPVLFKGLGVAQHYYPSADLRILGDLDLLFAERDLRKAVELALGHGFGHVTDDPVALAYAFSEGHNVGLVNADFGLLELHHALFRDCEIPFVSGTVERAVPTSFAGVPVQVLSAEDLLLAAAVHWGISSPGSSWVWLLDLLLIGQRLGPARWDVLHATAIRHGLQLFAAAALRLLESLWEARVAPPEVRESLEASLSGRERCVLEELARSAARGMFPGERLSVARRLSGRPVRGGRTGLLRSIICHPGVVCEELGVTSRSRWFWFHRLRHAGGRTARAWQALRRLPPRP